MFLLNFLPDSLLQFFVHALVVLGIIVSVLGAFANKIPFISQYGLLAKIVGAILFVIGVYFEGGYGVEKSWRAKVAEMEAKVIEVEKNSVEINNSLQEVIKKKSEATKEVQVVIKERIVRQAVQMDKICTVDDDAISILNDAAKNVGGSK